MVRVAEAITLCHDAGIVHGAIGSRTVFSQRDDAEDYRLGGYEACVHIADGDLVGMGVMLGTNAVSFRQD